MSTHVGERHAFVKDERDYKSQTIVVRVHGTWLVTHLMIVKGSGASSGARGSTHSVVVEDVDGLMAPSMFRMLGEEETADG